MKKQFNHVIDGGTWGGFKASHRLAGILNNLQDADLVRKVSKILNAYIKHLKALDKLEDCYEYFTKDLMQKYIMYVKEANLPYKVESHSLNIIKSFYRERLNKRTTVSYRLKITLNQGGLCKNKIFTDKAGSIQYNNGVEVITIPFTDENYFEKIIKPINC